MSILMWIVVGLVAGALASMVVGGTGYGLLGDIVIGIAGAVVGGWVFHEMHWQAPLAGVAGTIFVAFVGAALLLLVVRLIRRGRTRA
jgi:uncharacterized membrane protein YeaQ/YmgE (transglycosylase-associated protein family)